MKKTEKTKIWNEKYTEKEAKEAQEAFMKVFFDPDFQRKVIEEAAREGAKDQNRKYKQALKLIEKQKKSRRTDASIHPNEK